MTRLIIRIYDLFRKRPVAAWGIFITVTAALLLSVLRLNYKEDISDFLPLDADNQTALQVYQDISGANRIFAIVSARGASEADPDSLTAGVEAFVQNVEAADTSAFISAITKTVDMERMVSVMDEVYENIPYFLSDADYVRIDSLLSQPGYVGRQVEEDKQILMFPASGVTGQNISRDPLSLFTPVLGRLSQGGMPIQFETYDGYILSPDSQKAIVILESAFGAHESEHNADLVAMLNDAVRQTSLSNPGVDIHITGGPVIAVSNAAQIKNDSILAVCIAGVLILFLLIYVFRNVWNILLILVSVGWGWLFAMGCMAIFYDSVSIIVIGIASVILGIAVNYPLHLIDHLKDSLHPKAALKEIISPLIVGNVTTVGAFLCLVPLNAPALHDLGLFSSLLLVGTIIFVLLFLPHAVRTAKRHTPRDPRLITRLAGISVDSNRYVVWTILLLTCVFGYFSLRTEFDSDMRNINFMTADQKADMEYFQSLLGNEKNTESLYVVSNGRDWDEAQSQNEIINLSIDSLEADGLCRRHNAVSSFLSSRKLQAEKINRWNALVSKYKPLLTDSLAQAAVASGFSPTAFAQFDDIISTEYSPKEFSEFKGIVTTVFAGNVSEDIRNGRHSLVQTIEVPVDKADAVKNRMASNHEFEGLFFDVRSMNGAIADTLSNDFNYIGFACGCIVFLFLWLSFGSIELAIVSFMPMAVSWIWILGIMGMLGLKFNIVNVILATFIFGQGDDYTIFMTEGLTYEFAYRKKLLASYKNSIIVSALIMFIGIGTLIFARHPALRSLGEVTVVGMLSVVLMAYLFPPLVFNWLVRKNGQLRPRPVTLRKILRIGFCTVIFSVQFVVGYILKLFGFDANHMLDLRSRLENMKRDAFGKPAMIAGNDSKVLTPGEVCRIVCERYLYKGRDVERAAKKSLRGIAADAADIMDIGSCRRMFVDDRTGQGELALVLAVMYPESEIWCHVGSEESRLLLEGCADNFVDNVKIVAGVDVAKDFEKVFKF